jgi:HTH-type transcriptional regulator/antitoxin HigA
MTEHGLKQADLAGEIGSQDIVSEVLNGKRKLNARQAKALGERFSLSPVVFL